MSRQKLSIIDFTKGTILKADALGEVGIMRTLGFTMSSKAGTLQSAGGWEDWQSGVNSFREIQGITRWYDEDGGATLLIFGNNGSFYGNFYFTLENKVFSGAGAEGTQFDTTAPVLYINCDAQLIVLPDGKSDSPFSLKLKNHVSGRFTYGKLGLSAPTAILSLAATSTYPFTISPSFDPGVYQYAISYSYGTVAEPNKYGESALGSTSSIVLPDILPGFLFFPLITISNLPNFAAPITRINIYRTLVNALAFYKIGEITKNGISTFEDTVYNSKVDQSKVPATYIGLPGAIKCARWHNQRLYYFGFNGVFRWTAAGLPDVHPGNFYLVVGSKGYEGTWVGIIRNNTYVGKQDGIYIIEGDSPNYVAKKVSDIQCYSRASVVEMLDSIFFMGKDGETTRIYKFDGYTAVSISDQISPIFEKFTKDQHKRAYAIQAGNEYWLSVATIDTRFTPLLTAFNNCILVYNVRSGGWFPQYGFASAMVSFNGPQDNGEVYMCESNPVFNVDKGSLFKLSSTSGFTNSTISVVGTITVNKSAIAPRLITVGNIPALSSKDASMQQMGITTSRIRLRGFINNSMQVTTYTDSNSLDDVLGTFQIVPIEATSSLILTGDSATVWGTGKWSFGIWTDTILEDREFNIGDNLQRTGYAINFRMAYTSGKLISTEGVEIAYEITERE